MEKGRIHEIGGKDGGIFSHILPPSLLQATATAMFDPPPTVTGIHSIVDGSKSTVTQD